MWQSATFAGALSRGGSLPTELGTCCARVGRTPSPAAVVAMAASEAPLSNVRRAIMGSSRLFLSPVVLRRLRHLRGVPVVDLLPGPMHHVVPVDVGVELLEILDPVRGAGDVGVNADGEDAGRGGRLR